MPRNRRATGVGRGNGAGSRATQFKEGMPSANMKGRPRKPKLKPSTSLAEAAHRAFTETIKVSLASGQTERMTMFDACMKKLMSEFGPATFKEKLAFMRAFAEPGMIAEPAETMLREEAKEAFLDRLAREAERNEEAERMFGHLRN